MCGPSENGWAFGIVVALVVVGSKAHNLFKELTNRIRTNPNKDLTMRRKSFCNCGCTVDGWKLTHLSGGKWLGFKGSQAAC